MKLNGRIIVYIIISLNRDEINITNTFLRLKPYCILLSRNKTRKLVTIGRSESRSKELMFTIRISPVIPQSS